jgi:riboflavin kinase/FMN adenylyltransferase
MAMISLDWTEHPPPGFTGGAVAVGNFDGVHRGHIAMVAAVRRQADHVRGPAVVMSFDPPPHQVLYGTPPRPPLTTLEDRSALLHAAGADHVIILKTSPALLALSPEAFFEDVLVRQLGAKAVVEGYNFRFGRSRAGDTKLLCELCVNAGLAFEEVPPLEVSGEAVSSSRVRSALLAGDVGNANELLGRCYHITGTVVTGAKRGRTIGFPTANLDDVPTVLPGNGVYAVRASVDEVQYPAAANVGPNPTFGEDARKVEVHLIGFAGDLYGRSLAVEFVGKLRDTRPFAGVNELIEQLKRDIADAKRILA